MEKSIDENQNSFSTFKVKIKESGEAIYFLTNITDPSPYEIGAIYKQRWDIEPFFKFLKQHLNLTKEDFEGNSNIPKRQRTYAQAAITFIRKRNVYSLQRLVF